MVDSVAHLQPRHPRALPPQLSAGTADFPGEMEGGHLLQNRQQLESASVLVMGISRQPSYAARRKTAIFQRYC